MQVRLNVHLVATAVGMSTRIVRNAKAAKKDSLVALDILQKKRLSYELEVF
jgi:hypothetical protein